jgi:glycosyltransferase involved in cell wall biosynthesis
MAIISIITISYNAEKYLERTIKSIECQTNNDFEYILIDGNSKDGTIPIAKKYSSIFSIIISEPDQGIYDAMNKGIAKATGDFIWFMNAGDEIAYPNTIELIRKSINSKTDLVYGDALYVNEAGHTKGLRSKLTPHKLKDHILWQDLKLGMLVCHQSLIVKRAIAPKFIMNNLSADADWEIKSFKAAKGIVFIDEPLCKFLEGGVSNQNLKKSLIDRFKVLRMHFGLLPTLLNHFIILFRGVNKILKNRGKYW